MKAVILAAGHGKRLRSVSPSKPLTPVAGTPLIEHVIRAAVEAGIRKFRVVTGHYADQVEAHLESVAVRFGVGVEAVRVADWDLPNGHSVVAGASGISEDFLLLMSDHLFEPGIAERLIGLGGTQAGVTLAVDRNVSGPLLDLDDATRVCVGAGGEITAIGKLLPRFDAIDTGLFRASPALVEAIRANVAKGAGGSLSEGVQRLADVGQAWTLDIGDAAWLDVDDPRSLELAPGLLQTISRAGRDASGRERQCRAGC